MSRPKSDPAGNPRTSLTPAPLSSENLTPLPAIPNPPARLGARGKLIWAELWEAGGAAYHPPTDRFVIERYCLLHDRHAELWNLLDRDGFMAAGSQGQEVLHPAARALDTVEKEMRAIEDRLGLNPESRARLGIATIEHKSKLDSFLEGEL